MKFNFTKFLLRYYFRMPDEFVVKLGTLNQKGTMMAVIYVDKLWKKISWPEKLKSVLKYKWIPKKGDVQREAQQVFMDEIFGTEKDYGDKLYELIAWHNSREWNLKHLSDYDNNKIEAIQGVCILTKMRHREVTSNYLHLNLFERAPHMCFLVHPLVVKTPVISLQYALEIDVAYTFNSIREANHPQADELIAYLYDTIFIQQRIATSLHRLITLIDTVTKKDENSILTQAEMDAMKEAGFIITDLKATIEKMMVIIALTYGVTDLDSKRTHKQKMAVLEKIVPDREKAQPYYDFVFNFISSDGLDSLNKLRNGLVHKKGLSDLQPHSYTSKSAGSTPIFKFFDQLFEQHGKNTAVFLGILAFLTDDLVERSPHTYSFNDIPH